jgi:sulfur-carrier protein adenylyltransferase/sulfurtransferase
MDVRQTYERYQRQLILKDFGIRAQEKLAQAKVLVIGAGGLGCSVLQYLAAAGLGHIGIADTDMVSVSNLHRQILYNTSDVGRPKVEVAREKLQALNPELVIETWMVRWQHQQCVDHFPEYDIIVDATDNFASRYLINDACVLFGKPLVYGAVSQYEGQVALFNAPMPGGERSVNYRDLFPQPVLEGEVMSCAEGGVLGVLPGIIGTLQATEVIKWLTGIGETMANRMIAYNALSQNFISFQLTANAEAGNYLPESKETFMRINYDEMCGNK